MAAGVFAEATTLVTECNPSEGASFVTEAIVPVDGGITVSSGHFQLPQ